MLSPEKPSSPPKISRRTFFRRAGAFLAGHWFLTSVAAGGTGILGWSEYDTLDLRLEHWDLSYLNLPPPLEGKKIAQLSDLHLESLQIPAPTINRLIDSVRPDLLVLTGDLISTRTDLDKVMSYLGELRAPYGKYMVMGNNDYSHFSHTLFKRYLTLLKGLGWIPLLNQAEYLSELNLWIIGIDDPATAHDDVDKAYANVIKQEGRSFRLALAHSTDCLDDVAQAGADLFLTGHTHGGQIRLPGMKPLITNTYLGDKGIYAGYHVVQSVPLYINRGIGESMIPLRFNVPPEISVFTLRRGQSGAQHR